MFASGFRFQAERLPLIAITADRIKAKDKVHCIFVSVQLAQRNRTIIYKEKDRACGAENSILSLMKSLVVARLDQFTPVLRYLNEVFIHPK